MLEVIGYVRRFDRQRIPFRDDAAEFARPAAIGALAGGRLSGGVVRAMMRRLGCGGRCVEWPRRAGADHPANRHCDGQHRCNQRMSALHGPINTPRLPASQGARGSIAAAILNLAFSFMSSESPRSEFPSCQQGPDARFGNAARQRGSFAKRNYNGPKVRRDRQVAPERGRPALDGVPRFGFEGKVPVKRTTAAMADRLPTLGPHSIRIRCFEQGDCPT